MTTPQEFFIVLVNLGHFRPTRSRLAALDFLSWPDATPFPPAVFDIAGGSVLFALDFAESR